MSPAVHISEVQADALDTERSTAQTVSEMCGHVRASVPDPVVQDTAHRIVARDAHANPNRQQLCKAVWRFLKGAVRFVNDDEQLERLLGRRDELELLISPAVLLRARRPEGDCDDFTMLACALLSCLNIPPLIKTYKCDRAEPWRWSHVCAVAVLEDGSIFPIDASHGEYPGWEVPAGDVYQSQLWDMNGNRVGGGMGRFQGRGLSGYVAAPNWTGNEMTTVKGRHAGPYPSGDVMRAYYPGPSRSAGLNAIARGKYRRGLGDQICIDTNPDGSCAEYGAGPTTVNPGFPSMAGDASALQAAANANPNYYGSTLTNPTGTGINWTSFLNSLGLDATKLGAQALATPGTTILPNGTIIAGTPQGTSALGGGIGSSGMLILGLAAAAVVVFAMAKK